MEIVARFFWDTKWVIMGFSKAKNHCCYSYGFDFSKDEDLYEKIVKPFNVCLCCVFHMELMIHCMVQIVLQHIERSGLMQD
ncbi:hypothetical protein D3C80_839950 [compost metagenome]